MCGRVECSAIILDLALDGCEWCVSGPGRFTPGDTAPGTHWIGGWVHPKASLDVAEIKKMFTPAGVRTPVIWPTAIPTEHSYIYNLVQMICYKQESSGLKFKPTISQVTNDF
jgi:hypothetical protein